MMATMTKKTVMWLLVLKTTLETEWASSAERVPNWYSFLLSTDKAQMK